MTHLFKKLFSSKYSGAVISILIILVSYIPFYWDGAFLGDLGDPIGQTIPNKFLLVEYLKNGILPLWNSLSLMGFPMLADIQVGTFYLPDILFFSLFSSLTAHNISVLFHLSFAAVGIYFFLNQFSKSKFTSLTLSVMMVLSGSFLSRIVYLNFLETIAFVPWILLLVQKEKTSTIALACLIALMIFAGHPVALFYSLIVVFVFFVINHLSKFKQVLAGTLLGFLIAGIQLVPFLFLKTESVRDSLSYAQFTDGSLSFKDLFAFVSPFTSNGVLSFDKNIYFGFFAFFSLLTSIFFIKKFERKARKIYLTGLVLFSIGLLLSLGDSIPVLTKILYNLPVFNVIRVPARYILISHFGALLSLCVFLNFLIKKNNKLTTLLLLSILINSVFIPSLSLTRVEKVEVEKEYWPEIKNALESGGEEFTLTSSPSYFLSSSFFLFPNRHVLNFVPNLIGYNPMILKRFHDFFPVASVGAFENPNYFIDYYDRFQLVGLQYYAFPSSSYLSQKGLDDKEFIRVFLREKKWQKIESDSSEFELWKNPLPKEFAYLLNSQNTLEVTDFKPGEIHFKTSILEDDTLVVNQTFVSGWEMASNADETISEASVYKDIVQAYTVKAGTNEVILRYRPNELYYGAFLSLFGVSVILTSILKKKCKL